MDWQKVKADYISGGISYRKLAEKHGVSFNTLKTRAIEEQWYKLRQQKEHKTTTKIVETLSDKDTKNAVNLIDIADKLLKKIENAVDNFDMNELFADRSALKQITGALKDLKDIKGIKTDADMREQEARIRNLEKQIEGESGADKHVTVILNGDLDKYSK